MNRSAFVAGATLLSLIAAVTVADAGYKPEEEYSNPGDDAGPRSIVKRRKGAHRAPYRNCCGEYRFVYAESWYGFKRVAAPVRHAELGDQVRLPGGTWIYCEFSCEYTLRKQSLDFWEGQGAGGQSSVSPGIFRKTIDLDDYHNRHW